MRCLLIGFFFLLLHTALKCQDTISVYFNTGKVNIPEGQKKVLNTIFLTYDLYVLDSLHYIGRADSVGDAILNLRLSERRAGNVARYCNIILPRGVVSRTSAVGEAQKGGLKENRRVDILLFFKNEQQAALVDVIDDTVKSKPFCYYIDYKLLHRSNVRTITKRGEKWVVLETSRRNDKKTPHYFGCQAENGDFKIQKVRWKRRYVKGFRTQEIRYRVYIPEECFDEYKIFNIKDLPCDSCYEDMQNQLCLSNIDTCIQVDRFLMFNSHYKFPLFSSKYIKIRTPKEYVNLKNDYYVGCDKRHKLVWRQKKGRRRGRYYYARLDRRYAFAHVPNIIRVMDCCKAYPEHSDCNTGLISFHDFGMSDYGYFKMELGASYAQKEFSSYLGVGFDRDYYASYFQLTLGLDDELRILSIMGYKYHFLSFPYYLINPAGGWQSPTAFSNDKYGRLYVGADFIYRMEMPNKINLFQDAFVGFVHYNEYSVFPRLFVQSGFEFDYLNAGVRGLYWKTQIGCAIKVKR